MTKHWDTFRNEIIELYLTQNRPLHEVRRILMEEHGFSASIRAYRERLGKWRLSKYKCRQRRASTVSQWSMESTMSSSRGWPAINRRKHSSLPGWVPDPTRLSTCPAPPQQFRPVLPPEDMVLDSSGLGDERFSEDIQPTEMSNLYYHHHSTVPTGNTLNTSLPLAEDDLAPAAAAATTAAALTMPQWYGICACPFPNDRCQCWLQNGAGVVVG